MSIDYKKLAAPFDPKYIEWRIGRSGTSRQGKPYAMVLAYVTNRAIMQRLDDVVGPDRWRNEYKEAPNGGILCGISILTDNGWVTKWDGADNTDIEATKGGLSNSMKRAAVQWGVGRFLYDLEEGWANIHPNGQFKGGKGNESFKWDPPALPAWALPEGYGAKKQQAARTEDAEPLESVADAGPMAGAPASEGTALADEHEMAETIDYIREAGSHLADDQTIKVGRKAYMAKAFIRENWAEIKTNLAMAKIVAKELRGIAKTTRE